MKKKSRVCLYVGILLLYFSTQVEAQVIKIENGINISTMKLKGGASLETMSSYQVALGIDYLDHSWFNLSSNVGYMKKGSDEKIGLYHAGEGIPYSSLSLNAHYITLNTTFQLKKELSAVDLFVGVGPRIDFKIKDSKFSETDLSDNKFNDIIYGLKCETGFNYYLNEDVRLGLNIAYLPSFKKLLNKYREQVFSIGLTVGYILN